MAEEFVPESIEELTGLLRDCGKSKRKIELGGHFSKTAMGGEITPADVRVSTRKLKKVLAYEPADLTISVEAGLPYRELTAVLMENGQMLPLDPPFGGSSTIGGVIAANLSGPRRRRFGAARDMVIGMEFVTIEGKRVRSGGMVVKNVTGLDMAKLLVGSFGTLAAISTINLKVFPRPESLGTVAFASDSLAKLMDLRKAIVESVLHPAALDFLNAAALKRLGADAPGAYFLLAESAGNAAAVERCARDYVDLARKFGVSADPLTAAAAEPLWRSIREFTAEISSSFDGSWVLRVASLPSKLIEVIGLIERCDGERPALFRAANGVGYIACRNTSDARDAADTLRKLGAKVVVECAPPGMKKEIEHWVGDPQGIEVMRRMKRTFDPDRLLNPGRLHNLL